MAGKFAICYLVDVIEFLYMLGLQITDPQRKVSTPQPVLAEWLTSTYPLVHTANAYWASTVCQAVLKVLGKTDKTYNVPMLSHLQVRDNK